MAIAPRAIKQLTERYGIQLTVVLVLYAWYHAVAERFFFNGFLSTFSWMNKLAFGAGKIPAFLTTVPYYSFSITLTSLRHPYFLIAVLFFYVPIFFRRKLLLNKTITFGRSERVILFIAAFTLVWELTTYNYNYYLGNAFYTDRIVLVVLAVLLLRYPLLAPLFLAFSFVYHSQFDYAVGGFPLYDKRLLYDIVVMFMAHTYARLFMPSFKIPFIYFVFCIIGGDYFFSGFKKLCMQPYIYGWLVQNDPGNLFINVHYRGWLVHTNDMAINNVAAFLSKFRILLQGLVLLIEISGLFLLRSRKFSIALLLLFVIMHTGIFITGSMLFWKWMMIDITLVVILLRGYSHLDKVLFTKKEFNASLIIIPLSFIWLQPTWIGWYDTPVNQYFTYEVTTASGKVYELDKNEMNPYHQWFEYDNFLFLINKPSLHISGFGYANRYDVVKEVRNAGPEGFKALEASKGRNVYDTMKKAEYEYFIKTYFKNRNQRLNTAFFPSYLRAPYHLYSSTKTEGYHDQEPVRSFRIVFNQAYTQNGKKTVETLQVADGIFIPN